MQCAGHSEHSLFIQTLLAPEESKPIPVGVSLAAAKKKAPKRGTPKRSAKLKAMLRPPSSTKTASETADEERVVPASDHMLDLLPGAFVEGKDFPILDTVGQDKQSLCMATTNQGKRCRRKRTHGSFCSHHHELAASPKWTMTLFDSIKEPARLAMKSWEQSQLDLAIQLSEEENKELQHRMEHSYRRVDTRLAAMGLRRVPVPALGNCQFDSLIYTAEIPMTSMELRKFISQYLQPLARLFGGRMEGQFHGRYGAYCANLAKDGVWGDELSLLGAAHILQRPIVVVTDSLSENEFCRQISPPALIDESLWGQKVVLASILDRHFDATEPSR